MLTEPLEGMVKNSDSPEVVTPLRTHVARALIWPKLAGMFGSTHVPSGLTRTVRLSTLTVQFSSNCARAACAATSTSSPATTIRNMYASLAIAPISLLSRQNPPA